MKEENKIVVSKNGPYIITGNFPLNKEISVCDKDIVPIKWKMGKSYSGEKGKCALCRCGHSGNKPFCDGTHEKIKFNGTETASNEKYSEMAEEIEGPELILKDAPSLCSSARFCHRGGDIWDNVKNSDTKSKKITINDACDCPSGRLVICDKKGKAIEPNFKPSISFLEDGGYKVGGPIWVKGKIPIESYTGKKYEIRNRVTLCRCGKSRNKPFCDGGHISTGFQV